MTRDLARRYLTDRRFYRLQAAGEVDNPDQRIAAGAWCPLLLAAACRAR